MKLTSQNAPKGIHNSLWGRHIGTFWKLLLITFLQKDRGRSLEIAKFSTVVGLNHIVVYIVKLKIPSLKFRHKDDRRDEGRGF